MNLHRNWKVVLALSCLLTTLFTSSARAYTPESPKVQAIVKKGLGFLRGKTASSTFGMSALRGLAVLKATHDKKDPLVQQMAAQVARTARLPMDRLKNIEPGQYALGLACMFLADVDHQQYKAEIANLARALAENQKGDGAWTYVGPSHGNAHGDTSQTQYGAMASWVAYKKAEVPVDPRVFENAMKWLMKTQNQNGAFAYQPESPSEARVSTSLTAAGAASVLICADALGLLSDVKKQQGNSALKKVVKAGAPVEVRTSIPKANVMATVGRANNYFNGKFSWGNQQSYYYFLYTMERYMTFRDIAAGIEEGDNLEPAWYNQGVEVLEKKQAKDGSFSSDNGKEVGTCFAILFLMRSTKQTFESTMEGLVRGGYGLPKDVSTLREGEDGEVIGTEIKGVLDDVLALIEQGDDTDYEMLVNKLKDVKIEKVDARKRDAQMERLRNMVTSPKFGERLIAVRGLARDNNLDVAPGLIYALTDPDNRVALEAREGLRFVSRKFAGFGMPDNPNEAQKKAAQLAWKNWLRSIRPNAKFILQ